METGGWEAAARELIRVWLSALTPGAGAAGGFPEGGAFTGVAPDPTAHFARFGELLTRFMDHFEGDTESSEAMHAAICGMVSGLEQQVAGLRAATEAVPDPVPEWLAAQTRPVLGPGREAHRRWGKLAASGLHHLRAARQLQQFHFDVLTTALARLRQTLEADEGPALPSLRAVHDLWAGIADSTWRERAFTAEYAAGFAELVNTAAQLRIDWHRWQSPQLQALNLWPAEAVTTQAAPALHRTAVENASRPPSRREAGVRPDPRSPARSGPARKRTGRAAPVRAKPPRTGGRPAADAEFDIGGIGKPGD